MSIDGLTKRYGATVALSGVRMAIRPGEVHAVLGENGAGKSTLVKLLSGVARPDEGRRAIDGADYAPTSIGQARAAGVSTAFQELSLVPRLTVAENLLLPAVSSRWYWPERRSAIMRRAQAILDRWGVADIRPAAIVADLTLAQRQRVEIARALGHASRLLILDEPTAALPDTTWLFAQIRRVTAEGVGVLYISHRLSEVREICERATVLRNGESIGTVDLEGVDDNGIFAMMVGRGPANERRTRTDPPADGRVMIEARGLKGGLLRGVDLTLRAGEIIGVAGLEGQGQHELFRILGGASRLGSGEIRVGGQRAALGSPLRAQRTPPGIAFVPEERKTEGIFGNLTAAANIALPEFANRGWARLVNGRVERRLSAEPAERVSLAPRYLDFEVANLSGGNQQKVLLARALMTRAQILVLFDPARGVDVGTKQSIYAMMQRFAAQGGAILFYSSELSELVQLSTRCLVLYDGRIAAEVPRQAMSEERLLAAAHGAGEAPAAGRAGNGMRMAG
nr:sugar ABC transporter ATP-binding protein [Jiella sonneratiae]